MNLTDAMAEELLGVRGGAPKSGAPSSDTKRRGRPKGSKNKPKDGEVDTDPKTDGSKSNPENFTYVPDQTNIAAAAKLGEFIWYVMGNFLGCRALTPTESLKLGECIDPLMQKYLPVWADWKYEINAAMVIVGLYQITRIPKEEKQSESGAEVVE